MYPACWLFFCLCTAFCKTHEYKALLNTQESIQRKQWETHLFQFYSISGPARVLLDQMLQFPSQICSCPGCPLKPALLINIKTFYLLLSLFACSYFMRGFHLRGGERGRERTEYIYAVYLLFYFALLPFGRKKKVRAVVCV